MSSCHPVLTKQLNVTPQKTKVMKQGTMNILFLLLETQYFNKMRKDNVTMLKIKWL